MENLSLMLVGRARVVNEVVGKGLREGRWNPKEPNLHFWWTEELELANGFYHIRKIIISHSCMIVLFQAFSWCSGIFLPGCL